MSLILQFPTRCSDCGLKMEAGEEYLASPTEDGHFHRSHVQCPERKDPRGQNVQRVGFDIEQTLVIRKCHGDCKNLWTFRRGGRLAPVCPSCGGSWLRKGVDTWEVHMKGQGVVKVDSGWAV